jgi:ribosomal protein L7/L12
MTLLLQLAVLGGLFFVLLLLVIKVMAKPRSARSSSVQPRVPADPGAPSPEGLSKLQRIKLYREQTGAGLADAKIAVERMDAVLDMRPVPAAVVAPISLARVEALLKEGKKILAIKAYRELTGAGLADAKNAVERLEADGFLAPMPEVAEPAPTSLAGVQELVRAGQMIPAIKLYRELTGASLRDAKEAVDRMRVS